MVTHAEAILRSPYDWNDVKDDRDISVVYKFNGGDTYYATYLMPRAKLHLGLEMERYKRKHGGYRVTKILYAIRIKPKPPVEFRYGG